MPTADAGSPASVLSVGSSTSVASLWLMPRICGFLRQNPNVDIRLIISDKASELILAAPDLLVGYGHGRWSGFKATRLFKDQIVPICAPAFAHKHKIARLDALSKLPLIQLDRVSPSWTTWHDWLAAFAMSARRLRGPIVSNYSVALQAAELGLGVALGWLNLVRPLIDESRLMRMLDASIESPIDFFVAHNQDRALNRRAIELYDRLMQSPA